MPSSSQTTSRYPAGTSSSMSAPIPTSHNQAYDGGLVDGILDDDRPPTTIPGPSGGHFDVFEWHPAYLSCMRYFLDHAQHDASVQAVAALVNIRLPCQWSPNPILSSRPAATTTSPTSPADTTSSSTPTGAPSYTPFPRAQAQTPTTQPAPHVPLVPYIRRLVVTGFDRPPVLHGFFGDDWRRGVASLQECERRNFLFAAKSGGWATVKAQYDMGPLETVPFLQPLRDVELVEIEAAEKLWSGWLALEDWMIGPRAPTGGEGQEIKRGSG